MISCARAGVYTNNTQVLSLCIRTVRRGNVHVARTCHVNVVTTITKEPGGWMETVEHIERALRERAPGPLRGEFVLVRNTTQRDGKSLRTTARIRACTVIAVGSRGGVYVQYPQTEDTETKPHSVRVGSYETLDGEGRVVQCRGIFHPARD